MDNPCPYAVPWSTPPLWQAANQTIAHTIRSCRGALQPLVDLAGRIRERILAVDAYLEALCRRTCPQCPDNCCQRAHVYFDFKDLLYLHLGGVRPPESQTLKKKQAVCRYLTVTGCLLPRIQRPFICTWYICPDQRRHLERMAPSTAQFLHNSLTALKTGRHQLETEYARITARSHPT